MGFIEDFRSGKLMFDGSMGALLSSMGYVSDCPELYVVERPDVIESIHRSYIDAGANVIITDSLGATPIKLSHKGLSDRAGEFSRAAVEVAKRASAGRAYIAFDMGPSGAFMAPVGEYTLEQMIANFRGTARAAREAGADFILLETMTDIAECRAACIAAREEDMPVVASFTFEKNGRTLTGGTPECAALTLEAVGACGLGVNCSGGPGEMLAPLEAMRRVTPLPIVVQPNAGLPTVDESGKTVYSFTPSSMAPMMEQILRSGASAIGGCCGTTPEFIRAFSALDRPRDVEEMWDGEPRLCSARYVVTRDEAMAGLCEISDLEELYDLEESDACALIDLGGLSLDEAAMLVDEAQGMTKKPLAFRCDSREALDAALRQYAGVAGVMAGDGVIASTRYGFVRLGVER